MASAQEAQVQRRKKLGRDRILGGKMHIGKENNGRRAGNQDSAKKEARSRPRFVMENELWNKKLGRRARNQVCVTKKSPVASQQPGRPESATKEARVRNQARPPARPQQRKHRKRSRKKGSERSSVGILHFATANFGKETNGGRAGNQASERNSVTTVFCRGNKRQQSKHRKRAENKGS